jgi:hypothetical protein
MSDRKVTTPFASELAAAPSLVAVKFRSGSWLAAPMLLNCNIQESSAKRFRVTSALAQGRK